MPCCGHYQKRNIDVLQNHAGIRFLIFPEPVSDKTPRLQCRQKLIGCTVEMHVIGIPGEFSLECALFLIQVVQDPISRWSRINSGRSHPNRPEGKFFSNSERSLNSHGCPRKIKQDFILRQLMPRGFLHLDQAEPETPRHPGHRL